MKSTLTWARKKLIYIIVGIILIIIAIILIAKNKESGLNKVSATTGTVIQEIEATGKTEPADNVNLSFEKSGQVRSINVKIGDKVGVGQTLITLSAGELNADLLQAEAVLEAEQARLAEYKKGTRPEEITIAETKVSNSKIALENTRRNLIDAIKDTFTKSDDVIRNKTDEIFSNPRTNPKLSFEATNSGLKTEIEFNRLELETSLNNLATDLVKINTESNLNSLAAKSADTAEKIRIMFNKITSLLNSPNNLATATAESYKALISTSRSTVLTTLSSLNTSLEKFRNAESDLKLSENELTLKYAGRTPEEILTQQAKVKEAEAKIANIQSQISKTILRSPINGTISKQEAEVGEIVGANSNLVSIISLSNLEITANIPEINIGGIALGNPVSIEFDALPNEKFAGRIALIDPSETLINGVVNFKVTVLLEKPDPRIKSGFTSSLTIETNKKENVLTLPRFTIIEKENKFFVNRIISGNKLEEIEITMGLIGSNGNVEILSGLTNGDVVLEPTSQ